MTDSNRWGIINSSHSHSVQKRWAQMREYIESKGVSYDFVQSDEDGSVERLARMLCANGYHTVVVVGSDGSLNDAINGILSAPALPAGFALGIIPCGIGNDFANFWNIEADNYKQAIDNIVARRVRRIDVGVCTYTDEQMQSCRRYFLNCVNIGYGARLIGLSNRWQRLMGSKRLSLIPVFITQLFERKSFNLSMKTDAEHISQEVMSVCIGNATGYGQTPNSVPYNGLLDMSVITRPQWWQLFEGFWLLGKGRFLNYKNVHPYRVCRVECLDLGKASVSLDGRMLQGKTFVPMRLEVEKDRIDFIISCD